MLREVREETGYTLTSWKYRGIITFVYGEDTVEYMSLFTADGFEGAPTDCDEGVLEWVAKDRVPELNLWEGDRIFFRLLDERKEFFSLKLVYNKQDILQQAVLDGNSHYYLMLEDSDAIYDVSVADIIDVIKCELGEQVTVTYKEDKDVNTVTKLDIGEKAKDKTSSDKIEKETGTQE